MIDILEDSRDESLIRLLQEMPIFGGVTDQTLRYLLTLVPTVEVSRNDFFFRQGDPASSMYVLEDGKVAVIKHHDGHDFLLDYMSTGDCFGEMALLDLFPRSASVVAVEDCMAIEVSAATLYELQNIDLEQFTIIQMNMGREISRRLRDANERLFQARIEVEVRNGCVTSLRS